jgi:PAS domain S-box-containing protein
MSKKIREQTDKQSLSPHTETPQRGDQLQLLYEVSTAVAAAANLDEALQSVVEAVKQIMEPDSVALLLLEPDSEELVIRAWTGFPNGPRLVRRKVGAGIPGWVVHTGQAALVPDVRQDPRYHACDEDTRSELCVPLQVSQRVIGALNLESQRPAAFTEGDLRLLTIFAGNLAAIVENSRLAKQARAKAEALERRNRHLSLLHEIARAAASTLELQTLYQVLADTLAQIIGGDGCYITHIDNATGRVLGSAAYGPFRTSYPGMEPPPGETTLTESVLEAGRPLPVEDVYNSPYLSPRIASMFPARSQLGLPLRVGEHDLGAVLIAFNEPHTFTDEEIAWATQAVDLAALALENGQLFQRAEQNRRDWEATFHTMPELIAILDCEYRIVQANKALADTLGVTPEALVGQYCFTCFHGTEQPPKYCPHTQLMADGKRHTAEAYEEKLAGDYFISVSPIHDAGGQLIGSVHVAHDITERKRAGEERERLILELQEALSQVKTLSGLLPICAHCKKIRDDKGYWHTVEVYMTEHSEVDFSHGICPDCIDELYA